MARIYYNDNADHASFGAIRGNDASMLVGFGGLVQQGLLDLANWVEKGVTPPPSSRFTIDKMNQVVLPTKAALRRGIQPVVALSANGALRTQVHVGQPVRLVGVIDMPPGSGKVMQYDWYLGEKTPVSYEAPITLAKPKRSIAVSRRILFSAPGSYLVTLRAAGQRSGALDKTTLLQNLARVRVVVTGKAAVTTENSASPVSSSTSNFSVESTPVGTLLDNPLTRMVLQKHARNLLASDSFSAWRDLSLRAVQKLVGQSLRDEQLEAIQADFARLPPK